MRLLIMLDTHLKIYTEYIGEELYRLCEIR